MLLTLYKVDQTFIIEFCEYIFMMCYIIFSETIYFVSFVLQA